MALAKPPLTASETAVIDVLVADPGTMKPGAAWRDQARCAGLGLTDGFFPASGGLDPQLKALCDGCPVRLHCIACGVQSCTREGRTYTGFWGGLRAKDLRHLAAITQAVPKVVRHLVEEGKSWAEIAEKLGFRQEATAKSYARKV